MTTQIYDQLLSKYPVGHPLCLNSAAFRNDALTLLSYTNTDDSNPATNPPPIYTPPSTSSAPAEKLIAGIICDEQQRGQGQPQAIRLYDPSENTLTDLKVNQLRDQIKMEIDSEKNLKVSCVSGSMYEGQRVWTMIFNIFDASGWAFKAQNDISLNFKNTIGLTDSTRYDISLAGISTILKVQSDASASTVYDVSNTLVSTLTDASYSIYCTSGNELYIQCSQDASWNQYYVNSLKINLYDTSSNRFFGPSDGYLHLEQTGYDISYDATSDASFNIDINSNIPTTSLENSHLIKLDPSGSKIGTLYPYGYRIQPSLEYYNINTLTYHYQNLITLDPSGVILGRVAFS